MFCLYCFVSILWGSQLRIVTQVTLPFILFFAARVMIKKPEEIKLLLTVLIIAYSVLLIGSFYQIMQGTSIKMVESITGIERHAGIFKKIKPFSFAMYLFSIIFYFQIIINRLNSGQIKWALFFLLLISLFCIFKSYARSAYIGLMIFWATSLWGYNKKYFTVVLILSLIIGFIFYTPLWEIFFKVEKFDVNVATSGRIYIWEHNINLFLKSGFDRILAGHGLGVVSSGVIGSRNEIWSSHNDYLHVLMALGSIGLVLYFLIYLVLLKDVFLSKLDNIKKYFYYGIILSMIAMNFASGVTLFQVGISQQFWMLIGLFYIYRDLNLNSDTKNPEFNAP